MKFFKQHFSLIINIFFVLAIVVMVAQVAGTGYKHLSGENDPLAYQVLDLVFAIVSLFVGIVLFSMEKKVWVGIIRGIFVLISVLYTVSSLEWLLGTNFIFEQPEKNAIFFSMFIAFLSFSYKLNLLGNSGLHPAILFVMSFLFLIFLGSLLLKLPASTYEEISYVDALFTATSAVTVTGLTTLDTEFAYTQFGKTVILILIQLGGLGILTFSNLFALLFRSDSSFKNRMVISGFINEKNSSSVFKTLFKIFFITLLAETIGTLGILFTISENKEISNPLFFSIFHSVSAFCNAGFSTFSEGLFKESLQFNYPFLLVVLWLFITGGLGYNVMINHYTIVKNFFINTLSKFFKIRVIKRQQSLRRININSSLVLRTTAILLIFGTLIFYFLEYQLSLKKHEGIGKWIIALFSAATPRTAGFNVVDVATLSMPAILITIFLMWIGASPGSTGGGIKTSTFAVSMMGLLNLIRGKEKINYQWKEIPLPTLNYVNSIIILSIISISTSSFLLVIFEPDIPVHTLVFESVSAYSTVGLSMGITMQLSSASKITLMIVMFVGRVSFLTLLIGLYRQFIGEKKQIKRIFPKEKINF